MFWGFYVTDHTDPAMNCNTSQFPVFRFFRAWFVVLCLFFPCMCTIFSLQELIMLARVHLSYAQIFWYVHLNWMHAVCIISVSSANSRRRVYMYVCGGCISPICIFQWYWLLLLFSLLLPHDFVTLFYRFIHNIKQCVLVIVLNERAECGDELTGPIWRQMSEQILFQCSFNEHLTPFQWSHRRK